jgi:3-deoxy-D-arabino-heptulosonate 7-phosphate (DAHP) synthase
MIREILPNMVAPQSPTTEQLNMRHALSARAVTEIQVNRDGIGTALENPAEMTFFMPGYCTRLGIDAIRTVLHEGSRIKQLEQQIPGVKTAHRGPVWKPRSDPLDWHGQETTDPVGAHRSITVEAELHGNVAIEIGFEYHLPRYAARLAFMWSGAGNIENDELIKAMALHRNIPMALKNGPDGDIDKALEQVDKARQWRGENGAPIVLLYRGGTNAENPEDWEDQYIYALEMTDGNMIVDMAHGAERAFDPIRKYRKTVEGQILAGEAIIKLAEQGYLPAGITSEASDVPSDMDPHQPLRIALNMAEQLHSVKTGDRYQLAV